MFTNLVNEASDKNFRRFLIDAGPDLIICDEGHILKNGSTLINKAISEVRTRRRILLTGTPFENNLKELNSLINFVQPNLLGSANDFNHKYEHTNIRKKNKKNIYSM